MNILNKSYETLINHLKQRVIETRHTTSLRINKAFILLYHYIGEQIIQAQNNHGWGAKVIQQLCDILSHFKEGASYRGRVVQARTFPQVSDSQRKPMFSLHRLNIPSARRHNYKYRDTSIRGQEKSFTLYPRHKWTRVYGSVAKLKYD